MLPGFYREERGMAPYSALGVIMLLIVGVAIYHFNNVDLLKAQERNVQTFDMETFYSVVKIGQDIQQVARVSSEEVVLENSMSTYGDPIDVNARWGSEASFNSWKNELGDSIAREVEAETYKFYYNGNQTALEKQYLNPAIEFDFSNFILQNDIEVTVTKDRYDPVTKTQTPLTVNVGFDKGGIVSSKNRFTGHELTMTTGAAVTVDARPFTMADKTYDFTRDFSEDESVNQMAWHIWGAQEVLGLLEANVKHNVKFATDDRATYSLMQLIIAYKELEHFGTFDYVHTTLEFMRPWIGSESEATEFISLFEESVEGGYIDQAIESMDTAEFIRTIAQKVQTISNSTITASSYIDDDTVTEDGLGFESSEVERVRLSGGGTTQHLEKAEDTGKLSDVYNALVSDISTVSVAKGDVTSGAVNSLSVNSQFEPLRADWSEVRSEWVLAKDRFIISRNEITRANKGYSSLYSYIDEEKCKNPTAAMLWFGDANQSVKGLKKVLSAKVEETGELEGYYRELEQELYKLNYVEDDYEIDVHYFNAKGALERAEENRKRAKAAKDEYDYWMKRYGMCHDYACSTGRGDDIACYPGEVRDCIVETGWESYDCFCESTLSGDEVCNICYRVSYECSCPDRYESNARAAEATYREQMELVEQNLVTASGEVRALQTRIDAFFTDKGISNVYLMIDNATYSISDSYYSHWNYSQCPYETPFPGRRYKCARVLVPDIPSDIDEKNYASLMPKSPLTYDETSRNYSNYGLYYIKHVVDKMDSLFTDNSIDINQMREGKNALEEMKNSRFLETILEILRPIKKLMDTAGDVKSAITTLKHADNAFPNINEHFYTTLPLPPFNGSKVGFENQGFTVIHDIRLRADTRPGQIKLPIIGPVTLGKDPGINPSLPIPYTPISMYLWEFDIGPSKVGTDKNGASESSTLWLLDTENSQVAPLMELRSGNGSVMAPLYLHKPIMYKYEFTPEKSIRKGLNNLPPVFVLSLGPFMTRFGGHTEPPDKEVTDNPLAIDVSFDREFTNDSAILTFDTPEEDIYVKTYVTEAINGRNFSLSNEIYSSNETKEVISTGDLKLLGRYGWSEVKVDAYATDDPKSNFSIGDIKGEDHARVYFIDDSLASVGIKLEEDDSELRVINTGDREVDVAIRPAPGSGCVFILYEGGLAKNWIGSVSTDAPVPLEIISEGSTKITARVLMPEKVEKELERRGISLALEDET